MLKEENIYEFAKGAGERYAQRQQREQEKREEDNIFSEDALALRFSERHEHDLRYIAAKGQWLKWDGGRWCPEATLLAFDLARDSCRADAKE